MSFLNVFNKLRLISHQIVHQSRSLAFQVHGPKCLLAELQAPRIVSCQTLLGDGVKKISEPRDGTISNLLVSPPYCAGSLSIRLQQSLLPFLAPAPEAGDFAILLKDGGECKPKCPKKKKKKSKKKVKGKKKKKGKGKKKSKCKKKGKKTKKKKKSKKKNKCKKSKKSKKPKKSKKSKKKNCPKKPKCKKSKKDCLPKKSECKKKPKCEKPKCPTRPKCVPEK